MKKISKILVIFSSFFIIFTFLNAQQTVKIGVVDSQKILLESNRGKEVLAQLDKKTKEWQKKLENLDKEIQQLENKISTQRMALDADTLAKLGEDLQNKRTQRQRMWEDSQRDISSLRSKLFMKMRDEIVPIIQQFGKEKGYTLIVDLGDSGAIYWDSTTDITDEIIKRYNQKYPKKTPAKK